MGKLTLELTLLALICLTAGILYRRNRFGLVLLGAVSSALLAGLTIWEHKQRSGTPFALQEPVWFTLLARIIPVAISIVSVTLAARRRWPLGGQVTFGVGAGLLGKLVVIVVLYLSLLLFSAAS